MYTVNMLNEQINKEETLVFDQFTYQNAWKLASIVMKIADNENLPICMQVVIDDFPVVRAFREGTDESNIVWLERKRKTVYRSGKSSLRCGLEEELLGKHEEWYSNTNDYVIRGGGFPIKKTNGELVGALCISGLHHLDDNKMAITALEIYKSEYSR